VEYDSAGAAGRDKSLSKEEEVKLAEEKRSKELEYKRKIEESKKAKEEWQE
jgi:hypothetical protein